MTLEAPGEVSVSRFLLRATDLLAPRRLLCCVLRRRPLSRRVRGVRGPPLERFDLDEILRLIRGKRYFVLHAPRQTGKTSSLLALRDLSRWTAGP